MHLFRNTIASLRDHTAGIRDWDDGMCIRINLRGTTRSKRSWLDWLLSLASFCSLELKASLAPVLRFAVHEQSSITLDKGCGTVVTNQDDC